MLKTRDFLFESTVAALGAFNGLYIIFKLLNSPLLFAFHFDPVSESLVVNQNAVLNGGELLDNWHELPRNQLLVVHLQNVVELNDSDVAVAVFVNFSYSAHDVLLLVVLVDGRDELLSVDWCFDFGLSSVVLSQSKVAVYILRLVNSFVVCNVYFAVHLVKNDVVLLIINSGDIHTCLLILAFLAWERFKQLIFFRLRELVTKFFNDFTESVEIDLALVVGVSCLFEGVDEVFPSSAHFLKHLGENAD